MRFESEHCGHSRQPWGLLLLGVCLSLQVGPASRAGAQPVVSSVEGDFRTSATLTIRGSGFGAKAVPAPLLWDRLTNQPAYLNRGVSHDQIVPTRADGCADCPWGAQIPPNWGNLIRYWTTDPRTANGATYHGTTKGYLRGYDLGVDSPKVLYVNWWFRASASVSTGSNKLIRVWTDGSGIQRISWTTMHMTWEPDLNHDGILDASAPSHWANWGGTTGQWNNLEVVVDGRQGLSTGYGSVETRTNHNVIHDVLNWGTQPYNYIDVFGLDAGDPTYTAGVNFDFCDVYVDTTLARVLVSDSPTLAGGSHAEIQIPFAWSNDVVQVNVNRGTFPADSNLYVHVFSPAGQKSNYLALAPGADPGPPAAPGKPVRP